jgi:hypothetical protein
MAKIKNTPQWEAEHKAEAARVLAEAEESI